jgi:DNA-binding NarL/FixJ family response regulator
LTELANLDLDVIMVQILCRQESLVVRSTMKGSKARLIGIGIPAVDELIVSCVEAGVSGFVAIDGSVQDLINLTEVVALDRPPIPPAIAAALLRQSESGPDRSSPLTTLTHREIEIFNCLQEGLSNKEIARRLGIEVSTVKNHLHAVFQKLRMHRRGQAAVIPGRWQEVARPVVALDAPDQSRTRPRPFL